MLNAIILFILSGLVMGTPLLIMSMGGVITERSGTLNLGLEGTMLTGAFFSYYFAITTGSVWLGLLGGIAGGLVIALFHGIAMIYWNTNQVVTAVAINMAALGITNTLMGKFSMTTSAGNNISPGFEPLFKINLGEAIIGVNWFFILALIMIPLTWFVIQKTTIGLAIRAVGEYPTAAATMGIRVRRVRMLCFLYSGAIAALAGAALTIGDVRVFVNNMTAGKGFIAFACIVFGRYTAMGTAFGALVFGISEAFRNYIQIFAWSIPGGYMTSIMIPYIITLLLLIFSKQGNAPKAWAIPYEGDDN
ncbi:MAG: ABC transporter permease [Firmicutes bacterium]|nr:ABC transporter permease [Bacillota bacterium]